MGHMARLPEQSVGYVAIRAGGLWHTGTLRAMGRSSGHVRHGPQRRIDNRVSEYCRGRGFWWVGGTSDRDTGHSMEDAFVDTIAPDQTRELVVRDHMKAQKDHPPSRPVVWCEETDPWAAVVWADNVFLVGSDSAGVQRRLADIQVTFATRGLAFSDLLRSLAQCRGRRRSVGPPADRPAAGRGRRTQSLGRPLRPLRQHANDGVAQAPAGHAHVV